MSFHGGHSGQFCQHAQGTLEELVVAAIDQGLAAFGITEHMAPVNDYDRYSDEVEAGLTADALQARFRQYATETVPDLKARYGDRIELLLGMETEILPVDRYPAVVASLRQSLQLQYIVGSVHHVDGLGFDVSPAAYEQAAAQLGGLEAMFVLYYRAVQQMLEALRPEVVGHLDLIRKYAPPEFVPGAEARAEARACLEIVADYGGVLDVNARALKNGQEPYPGRELLTDALRMGIEVTFGDDSHAPEDVGVGLDRCREILLEVGYNQVVRLGPTGSKIPVPLN